MKGGLAALTEGQARNKLGSVKVFTSDFRPMKNVLAGRDERSLYKLVLDGATDEIVGIHMIGPDAPEILQAAAVAVKVKLKITQVLNGKIHTLATKAATRGTTKY